ncbi:sugar kinase [Roseibacterium beibuensis]|uniref:Sugar kinase n=1 Tax=[Roseibacterium] beibuensis TaxID=1193142 RepID=A0ABP9L2H9_9RHOB|nr:sugar kinase [Roseibacterium beibuensis]MCS6621685.1 sugar kinase [Roseibacterium beibuensis]
MPDPKRPIRRIACVGEVMIELIARADGTARIGVAGDTYNTAVYMVRALRGSGIHVSYVTALGDDPYSDRIMDALRGQGVESDLVERRVGMMPGLYAIDTDARGERSFSYWRSTSAARSLFDEPCEIGLPALDGFDLVYLSGITLAILPEHSRARLFDWAEQFTRLGGTLAYDSNYRPRLWDSPEAAVAANTRMWRLADIALPSLDDEERLSGLDGSAAVLAHLRALGATRGALKRGDQGPIDLATGQTLPAGSPVEVVDSTAAGDSFNAAYLAALARGQDELSAMAAGHGLAAEVIRHPGAIMAG